MNRVMTSLAALGAFPALGGPVAHTLDQTPQIRQRAHPTGGSEREHP